MSRAAGRSKQATALNAGYKWGVANHRNAVQGITTTTTISIYEDEEEMRRDPVWG
jgi:hypothetical protein